MSIWDRRDMGRYIRFIVHQRIGGESRHLGVFSAAYSLWYGDDLLAADRARLDRILRWFVAELPIPPSHMIPVRAIFWYRDLGRFSGRMWELARFLTNHGFLAEQVTARFVGRIVYQDSYQVAAFPWKRRHRGIAHGRSFMALR
jgi:hypothetical protein